MDYFFYVYIFALGLILGSFYNVVGIRVPNKESLLGRSSCPHCSRQLTALDLIPFFGYIFLGGKCKSCKRPISIKYPLMELLTGLLFLVSFVIYRDNMIEYIVIVIFVSLMVIVSVSDLYYKIVPDIILLIFFPALVILRIYSPIEHWYDGLIGGMLGFSFMYVIGIYGKKMFKKEALGGGDIKLYFLVGLFLGYQNVFLSLFFAAFAGLVHAIVTGNRERMVPFVPFIFFGSMVAYFVGDILVDWYVGLFI
jgi:leader peptidase (prepilin peptidase)/N-methyltransferase